MHLIHDSQNGAAALSGLPGVQLIRSDFAGPMVDIDTTDRTVKVIVLASSSMAAQLLADALERDHFEVVYGGCSLKEALAEASRAEMAVVCAHSDDQLQACELGRQLRCASTVLKMVLLIENPTREIVVAAFRSGFRGIFSHTSSPRDIQKCVLAVKHGQVWVDNTALSLLLEALLAPPPPVRLVDARGMELLSKREEDVVRYAVDGLTNREIAERLGLSQNTVKNYLFRVFQKLGISSRVELTLYVLNNAPQRQFTTAA